MEYPNETPGEFPSVANIALASDSTGVYLNTAINVDVSLPNMGAGVEANTLNTTNVQLYRTQDNALVPGTVNTTGGGDAIVFQPSVQLEPNTNYTFIVTNSVLDESGASFIPYCTTFDTGTNTIGITDSSVQFTKSTVYEGSAISSLAIAPDLRLYATTLDGKILRWDIDSSGDLENLQTYAPEELNNRAIIGAAFEPNTSDQLNLWISNNDPLYPQPANDFTGKISKITIESGSDFNASIQDYITGLPRSGKDHLSNSLAFGPDDKLYLTQGSNTATGNPDSTWYNRPERLLSAAVLQIDPTQTPPPEGFNVQTEEYTNSQGVTTIGNYDPNATDAPVKLFATGVRNAYDLVWHSNGKLYVPTNGTAAGGNTPDDPTTPTNEAMTNVGTQNDYLFKIEPVGGGYYGHPNPLRQEYILNGGNPSSEVDMAEVVAKDQFSGYSVGTMPDPDYQGAAFNFDRNRSPNGIIEYKSDTFNGALKNKLLVVEYSGGDDILALSPDPNGNIAPENVSQVVLGLTDPVDLIEDTQKNLGNLYVAELIDGGTKGQISLLDPI